jgi:hypothetical protein
LSIAALLITVVNMRLDPGYSRLSEYLSNET